MITFNIYRLLYIQKNKCRLLIIGSIETSNKLCIRECCRIHNTRLKVPPRTKPCIKYGKGTYIKCMIGHSCGYPSSNTKEWNQNERTLTKEFSADVSYKI